MPEDSLQLLLLFSFRNPDEIEELRKLTSCSCCLVALFLRATLWCPSRAPFQVPRSPACSEAFRKGT